jgi:hypothetical protein
MTVEYTMQGSHLGGKSVYIIQWSNMANGDVGNSLPLSQYADRSVQVSGTFGSGGTVAIQGSNNGNDFVTLTDPLGNPLSFTSSGIEAITEMVAYIRPSVIAGDVNTSLQISLAARA